MTVAIKFCLPGLSSRYLKCCTSLIIVLLVMVVRENLLQIHSITEVVYNDPDLHNPLIFLPHQSSGGLSGSRSRLVLGLTSIAISNQESRQGGDFLPRTSTSTQITNGTSTPVHSCRCQYSTSATTSSVNVNYVNELISGFSVALQRFSRIDDSHDSICSRT